MITRLPKRYPGIGGFIHVTQPTGKVVFCGSFTAAGLNVKIEGDQVKIIQEGKIKKFVDQVKEITFSGDYAREKGQPVLIATERAVFELREEGMVLTEVAPGIDLERDILGQMEFKPIIAEDLKEMPPEIFMEKQTRDSFHNLNLKEKFNRL